MYFGIDKVVLGNIAIKGVDLDHLEKLSKEDDVVFIKEAVNINHHIQMLTINDKQFGKLMCGYKIAEGRYIPYVIIDVNKPRVEANNLVPQSMESFNGVYLKGLQDYIRKAYRLDLDFERVKFKTMEINCTFPLDEEYKNYHHVFKTMMKNAPKTYKLRDTRTEHKTDVTTYYLKNNSLEVKVYNKLVELERQGSTYNMNDNVCRIEYKLMNDGSSSKKIESAFGMCEVAKITTEDLKRFFMAQFEKDFVKPMEKAVKEQCKVMKQRLKDKKSINRQYVYKVAIEMISEGKMIDINLFYEAIKQVDKANGRRTVNNFKKDLDVAGLENNLERFNELVTKVKEIELI